MRQVTDFIEPLTGDGVLADTIRAREEIEARFTRQAHDFFRVLAFEEPPCTTGQRKPIKR
jgi:hypothetical protein